MVVVETVIDACTFHGVFHMALIRLHEGAGKVPELEGAEEVEHEGEEEESDAQREVLAQAPVAVLPGAHAAAGQGRVRPPTARHHARALNLGTETE